MTVAELIEKLRSMPQNMKVYVSSGYGVEKKAENVFITSAYGQFECVEIN